MLRGSKAESAERATNATSWRENACLTNHFDAPGYEHQVFIARVAAAAQRRQLTLQRRMWQQADLDDAVVEAHPVFQRILDGQGHRMPLLMQRPIKDS
jgi:hypothetical protein